MRLILLFLAFVVQSSFAKVCVAHFDYTYSNGQWIPLEKTKITEQFNCGVRFQDSSCTIRLGESKERMTSEADGCEIQGDEVFCGCTNSHNCNAKIAASYEKAVKVKPNLAQCGFSFDSQPDYGDYEPSKQMNCPKFWEQRLFSYNTWRNLEQNRDGRVVSLYENITDQQCEFFMKWGGRCEINLYANSFDLHNAGCHKSGDTGRGIVCRCTDHDMCSLDVNRWVAYARDFARRNGMSEIDCDFSKMPSYPGQYASPIAPLPPKHRKKVSNGNGRMIYVSIIRILSLLSTIGYFI